MATRTMEERIHDHYKDSYWARDLASYTRARDLKDRLHSEISIAAMQKRMDEIKSRWPARLHKHFET